MKEFISLLFPDEESYLCCYKEDKINSDDLINLNIKIVIEYLKEINEEFNSNFFSHFINDQRITEYRLSIMDDLYHHPNFCEQFININDLIYQLKDLNNEVFNTKHTVQKQLVFLNLILQYVHCIEAMHQVVSHHNRTTGLNQLNLYLEDILHSQQFTIMKEQANFLKKQFKQILDLSLNISYSNRQLSIESNTKNSLNLSESLQSLCDELFGNIVTTDFSVVQTSPFSGLEEKIARTLEIENQDLFDQLNEFYREYHQVNVYSLIALREEIIFYLTYIQLVRKFEEKGFTFCRPQYNDQSCTIKETFDLGLAIKLLKENTIVGKLVTNDMHLEREKIFVLTGPNQGGKTTYLRSIGLITILSQAGCMIPGEIAELVYFDKIFTHFPQEETVGIHRGRLADETNHIKSIINKCTLRSLILINEPFSSTRRMEGSELLQTMMNNFLTIGGMCIITTHYYEMLIQNKNQNIISLIAKVNNNDHTSQRTYKIEQGVPTHTLFLNDLVKEAELTYEQLLEQIRSGGIDHV